MKKLFTLLLLLVSGLFINARAEYVWKTGYVVLVSGDTVKGEVRYNTKKEIDLFSKVQIKLSETEKKSYNPAKVKSYSYEDVTFVTRKIGGELAFVKVLTAGRINIFEFQYEIQRGSEINVETEYFIENTTKASDEPQKLKTAKFKKIAAELMADHTELVERIEAEDKKYELSDCINVAEEYNEWAATN
jgi:arginine deiminase